MSRPRPDNGTMVLKKGGPTRPHSGKSLAVVRGTDYSFDWTVVRETIPVVEAEKK